MRGIGMGMRGMRRIRVGMQGIRVGMQGEQGWECEEQNRIEKGEQKNYKIQFSYFPEIEEKKNAIKIAIYQIRNIKHKASLPGSHIKVQLRRYKPAVLFEWNVDVRTTCNDRQFFFC